MRHKLRLMDGERIRFRAIVERYGTKAGYKGGTERTLLLRDVCIATSNGQKVTDHLWFTAGKNISTACAGDVIEFDARVGAYTKGCGRGRELDFCLKFPTKIEVIGHINEKPATAAPKPERQPLDNIAETHQLKRFNRVPDGTRYRRFANKLAAHIRNELGSKPDAYILHRLVLSQLKSFLDDAFKSGLHGNEIKMGCLELVSKKAHGLLSGQFA